MSHHPSAPAVDRPPVPRAGLIIAVLAFGSLCAALMQSLVIPIQSELPELLHTSAANTSWVVTATLLGAAVAMPVTGRLADIVGKRPVLLGSALILVVGSLVCAVSSSLPVVLTGRVLQGVAMGFIPVAISFAREVAPPTMVNTAVAGISATLGVGGALGLPLAAWIAQSYDWHLLFWISTALAALIAVGSATLLPRVDDRHPARLDLVGAVGLGVGLVLVLVALTKGSAWGWGSATTLGMIGGGGVVLLAWGWYELRHHDPLVDLRTTARRPVLLTNLAALLIGFGMMAQSIVVPQLLQMPAATGFGLDQSILQAGLWMAPAGVMMMLMTPVSSRILSTVGGRPALVLGAVVLGAGYVLAVFLTGAPWQLMIATCVASAGVGIGYAAMPTLIMQNVPAAEAASGVGVNALMRSMGTTVAGAVMALVLTSTTVELTPGVTVPAEGAFRLCFIIGAAAALAGAAVAWCVGGARSTPGARPAAGADRPSGADVEQPSVPV
ncbi:MFS transporter [Cellulomonas sp. RIT-PI-Y]|uniref:MFS transporter n=1 Tax=Cellulomonas sp. RIT-PI-Y TaxID=3035297 RepID=UPI0021DAC47F|nr:MFS transporter [Cellulomonas sp. RIT-PI-Y]